MSWSHSDAPVIPNILAFFSHRTTGPVCSEYSWALNIAKWDTLCCDIVFQAICVFMFVLLQRGRICWFTVLDSLEIVFFLKPVVASVFTVVISHSFELYKLLGIIVCVWFAYRLFYSILNTLAGWSKLFGHIAALYVNAHGDAVNSHTRAELILSWDFSLILQCGRHTQCDYKENKSNILCSFCLALVANFMMLACDTAPACSCTQVFMFLVTCQM